MKINGIDQNTTFNSYKEIPVSYTRGFLGLGKLRPNIIDSYCLFVDFSSNIGKITKGDATDYGMSSYSMFQDDFDTTFEYDLKDNNDYLMFKTEISKIFGENSNELNKIISNYENKN